MNAQLTEGSFQGRISALDPNCNPPFAARLNNSSPRVKVIDPKDCSLKGVQLNRISVTKNSSSAPRVSISTSDLNRPCASRWHRLGAGAAVFLICIAASSTSAAQTVTTLLSFGATGPSLPVWGLVQGTDGNFYGTSAHGGTSDVGTVFKMTPQGNLTTLHSFCSKSCTEGQYPYSGLVLGTDGNFYGTTDVGGATSHPDGTVFKITPQGALTTLHTFCSQPGCTDGAYPRAPVVQGADGNFYGTTYEGGTNNLGAVFRISPQGHLTTLYSFCSLPGCADGQLPTSAGLLRGADGNFYGTTPIGGANGDYGTVFKLTSAGKFTTIYSFCSQTDCADGIYPYGLVQATNGNIYGTTAGGGLCPYSAQGCGTVFEITLSGKLITLYNFCSQENCPDGANPAGPLQLASDGNFYGVTDQGGESKNGTSNGGTIFKITPAGKLTTLYAFCSLADCADGADPNALVQGTGGSFWGLTDFGSGTVFKFAAGLGPFVETIPRSRKVGGTVTVLGNSLTDSTSVSFNGTAAAFTVVSGSEITATVPTDATTGKVKVVTTHGTLVSNVPFTVIP
jgi:uncharacterized repeat protein (TIGR03803 family)